ncbi:TIGR04066 family peptide maturation system protein [Ruminiclostridium herbifermentans]|uniref:TIGR04066 family peptide maturation system protein n=1 Tax=Ruminiclostridium herbifermentans TaxID=2488810 RepID=A0A4U7JF66_9FIRM|nr:TIGR04066 family peptide maturation system protein [Ruminiclostridium herbifermentans]QNU67334.1 TIGR04066 family peptide maturation system protein [Ruminiclostridium herbifermentans]
MERLIVYPFDIEFSPVLRHMGLIENYTITALISPRGWWGTSNDACIVDGGKPTGLKISSDFESNLEHCDTVLISDYCKFLDYNKSVFPKIVIAVEHKRNIICTLPLEENQKKQIADLCQKKGVYFKHYHIKIRPLSSIKKQIILDINTPIICVAGISERTDKFNVQLALREKFLQEGYKVSQVGSKSWCELLGFHSFPNFMYSSYILESDKIVLFNQYIKNIEEEEQPDVIILGIPGGIIPINNNLTNRFGILAYMVSQAIIPDAFIFCTLYEDHKSDYYEELAKSMKYKFGFEVDAYSISNTKFDWSSYMSQPAMSKKFEVLTINNVDVDSKINSLRDCNFKLYNIKNEKDKTRLSEYIIDKLVEYGTVDSL